MKTPNIPIPKSRFHILEDLSDKSYSEISDHLLVTRPSGDFAANYIWSKYQEIDLPGFGKPNFLNRIKLSLQGSRFEAILDRSVREVGDGLLVSETCRSE